MVTHNYTEYVLINADMSHNSPFRAILLISHTEKHKNPQRASKHGKNSSLVINYQSQYMHLHM